MFESVYTQRQLERAQQPLEERIRTYARNTQAVAGMSAIGMASVQGAYTLQNFFSKTENALKPVYDLLHTSPQVAITAAGVVFFTALMVDDILPGYSNAYKGVVDSQEYNP